MKYRRIPCISPPVYKPTRDYRPTSRKGKRCGISSRREVKESSGDSSDESDDETYLRAHYRYHLLVDVPFFKQEILGISPEF